MLQKQGLGENCENRGRAVICRGARLRDANWREGSSGRKATGALQWPAKRIIDTQGVNSRLPRRIYNQHLQARPFSHYWPRSLDDSASARSRRPLEHVSIERFTIKEDRDVFFLLPFFLLSFPFFPLPGSRSFSLLPLFFYFFLFLSLSLSLLSNDTRAVESSFSGWLDLECRSSKLSTGFNHETNEFIRSRRGDRWPSSFRGISCGGAKLLKPIVDFQPKLTPIQEPRSSVTTWRKLVETLLLPLPLPIIKPRFSNFRFRIE